MKYSTSLHISNQINIKSHQFLIVVNIKQSNKESTNLIQKRSLHPLGFDSTLATVVENRQFGEAPGYWDKI